ncbi:MAG: hypothetical protein RL653_3760 [Pseudomonadota bacterium]
MDILAFRKQGTPVHTAIHVDSIHHSSAMTLVTGWSTLGTALPRDFPQQAVRTFRRPDVARAHGLSAEQGWGFVALLEGAPPPVVGPSVSGLKMTLGTTGNQGRSVWDHLRCAHPDEYASVCEWVVQHVPRDSLFAWAERADLGRACPPVLAHVDASRVVGDDTLVLSGWVVDVAEQLESALLVLDGRVVADLAESWVRFPRPDVLSSVAPDGLAGADDPGFKVLVRQPAGSWAAATLLLCTKTGQAQNIPLGFTQASTQFAIELLLEAMISSMRTGNEQWRRTLVEWAQSLWGSALVKLGKRPVRKTVHGPQPDRPKCSVIIPLYGRADFMLHQLVAFSADPGLRDVEFVFVNDDPRLSGELEQLAREALSLGAPSFVVVDGGGNRGYSGANNLGASHARSELLLLLNSDVMPRTPGWLDQVISAYQSLEGGGALGVRLVYDDGCLQHAGMVQRRMDQYPGIWWNVHPDRGVPEHMVPGKGLRRVDLVTGACLMVSAAKYAAVGGLDAERYIIGDFEDSDLCMKLKEKGWQNWLLEDVVLVHLERQSQGFADRGAFRFNVTLANAWEYARRWGATLEAPRAGEGETRP